MLGSPEHRALAREVAARSVVLLRNEPVDGTPVLPLAADGGLQVAVLGRLADTVNLGDGGSSDVWDLDCHTVLDGLRGAVDDVVHDDGSDVEHAATVAAGADVAVVVVGYTYLDEGEYIGDTDPALADLFPKSDEPEVVEQFDASLADLPPTTKPPRLAGRGTGFGVGGDRSTLRLPPEDVALIRAVAAANPRTVVAIQAGSAVVVTEWIDLVPAVVQAWYGGCQAGPGLADVLLGAVNPSARLPFSVPAEEVRPPAVRTRRHPLRLRPLARVVASRPHRHRAGVPLRLRPVVHDLRAGRRRRLGGRARKSIVRATVRNTGAATEQMSCRSTRSCRTRMHPRASSDSLASRCRRRARRTAW